jgi:flagellar biosynthesis protein FlhF
MRVKTFRGENPRRVMDQVKAELGPDAVILDTKNRRENGRCVCEITAALEAEGLTAPAADGLGLDELAQRPGWGQWHREWDQIKGYLLALARPQMDLDLLAPRQRQPLQFLESEGVAEGALMTLWRRLKEDRQMSALSALGELVRVKPFASRHWAERIHVFSGPAGCGKTSSLLRLALRAKREAEGAKVVVVNADNLQGKGRLLLKHYAELSGLIYTEAATAADMARIAESQRDAHRIFVDLPCLPGDMTLTRHLQLLGLEGRADVAAHLVLSPHFAPAQYAAFLGRYHSPKTASIIWTKLDEACTFGAMVNVAQATGLPASALSFGAGLRDTLVPAERLFMWKLIFKRELPDAAPAGPSRSRYAQ